MSLILAVIVSDGSMRAKKRLPKPPVTMKSASLSVTARRPASCETVAVYTRRAAASGKMLPEKRHGEWARRLRRVVRPHVSIEQVGSSALSWLARVHGVLEVG